MFLVIGCWVLIFFVARSMGKAILGILDANHVFADHWDLNVTAVWLGLGVAAVCCLTVAFFAPVTSGITAALFVAGLYLAKGRSSDLFRRRSLLSMICYGTLIWGLALHAAIVPVDAYDTALYHQQAVSLLSQYGLVPGAAWFHFRLGFNPAWFALAAALNHGFLIGRISPVLGGFVMALCVLHLVAKLVGLLKGEWHPADWYLLVSYPVFLAITCFWHYDISLSPDLPTWVVTILVVWTGCLVRDLPGNAPARYLPLLLASLGACFKFSLLPLLPAAGVFVLSKTGIRALRPVTAALCSVPVLVAVLANLLTSGCPFYPSPAGCQRFDWSVPKGFAESVAQDTTDWARWGVDHDSHPEVQTARGSWIQAWLHKRDRAGLLAFCAAGALSLIALSWRERDWFALWCLMTGLSGLVFIAWGAPNPRFGLGYFLLPPASALAIGLRRYRFRLRIPAMVLLPVLVTAVLLGFFSQDRSRTNNRLSSAALHHQLSPDPLANSDGSTIHVFNRTLNYWTSLHVRPDSIGDFRFVTPTSSDQCWDYQPCSPVIVDRNFEPREPARGMAGGFRSMTEGHQDR